MRLRISGPKTRLTTRLRSHVRRRVHFGLSRFGTRVTGVRVRVAETTAARGRGEPSCEITVTVRGAEPLRAEHHDQRMTDAVDHAVARVTRHVARTVELLEGRLALSREARTATRGRR